MSSDLMPVTFAPLRLGTLRPRGWLKQQLDLQAGSLSGNLDRFWPDVASSRWFGGDAEAWERAPYWLDGAIPLAFLSSDSALRGRVCEKVEHVLEHQHSDGWLGPREMVAHAGAQASKDYDLWAQFLALKALVQYHDATGDQRVPGAIERNLRTIEHHIDRAPLSRWGQFRWFEALVALQWLLDRDPQGWLVDLAAKLAAQGFDWTGFFARWPLTQPTARGRWTFMGHVVNNAMAIKQGALWWRHSAQIRDRAAPAHMMGLLDRHHGMVTGVFTGDECLAGRSPVQGTELCAVMEYAYSLEVLASVLGDAAFGDRLERIVFNALPATFSPDMWSHQYDQQVNQIECSVRENRTWFTNGPAANIFGLEPNYGCCTANLSQGWPKYAASLWMAVPEGGLAAVAYSPCELSTSIDGTPVQLVVDTQYPFRDEIGITVRAEQEARFPVLLRIPAWADGATISISSDRGPAVSVRPGAYHRVERAWRGETRLRLRLPMRARLWRGPAGSVALERGPLVYALPVPEEWRRINQDKPHRELPHADWEVHPTGPWNYALELDEAALSGVTFREQPVGEQPFSPSGAPVCARVRGRRLASWEAVNGSAADVPAGPVRSPEPEEELTLIPYGCTNLRVTEFPVLGR